MFPMRLEPSKEDTSDSKETETEKGKGKIGKGETESWCSCNLNAQVVYRIVCIFHCLVSPALWCNSQNTSCMHDRIRRLTCALTRKLRPSLYIVWFIQSVLAAFSLSLPLCISYSFLLFFFSLNRFDVLMSGLKYLFDIVPSLEMI